MKCSSKIIRYTKLDAFGKPSIYIFLYKFYQLFIVSSSRAFGLSYMMF